ncbi:MAG: pyridoxal-phosphate dependent enzyme, partial [Candidatus Aminicenantes bacterium]|nr:pyridoxal-phosphate dependent enzyme [Candidatus Aminicenantes bacterium]
MCEYAFNEQVKEWPVWPGAEYDFLKNSGMLAFHRSLPGYEATPLRELPSLAFRLGLGAIFVKDESRRFGVKAFKALGASYAIYRFLKKQWQSRFQSPFSLASFQDREVLAKLGSYTFCAATDGNHGRAVAWTAKMLGQHAVIYMPTDSVPARVQSIRGEGAEVVLVEGTFDHCVERCAADAASNGWQAVSDTAYPGYRDIPGWILLGYTSIFAELEGILHQSDRADVDAVVLPAGVGGLAAA